MKKSTEERELLIRTIDAGLRETFRFKKKIMAGISRKAGNPRLNSTHYRTLLMINDMGPQCMKQIRTQLGLEAGSFTPVVDRLIEEGLIERERDERDRRKILLMNTENGSNVVVRIKVIIQDQIINRLSILSDELLTELAGSMEVVRRVNEKLQDIEYE